MNKLIRAVVLPASSMMLFACGSESQVPEEDRLAQIAVINPVSTSEGEEVNITATVTDADTDFFTIRWEQISGPQVTLSGTDTTSMSFVAPWVSMEQESVSLEFRARVNENGPADIARIVTVNVDAVSIPPVISLPFNEQEAYALNEVTIECESDDLDGENVQISVTNVNATDFPTQQFDRCPLSVDLSNATTSEPTHLQLIVEDEDGLQDTDSLYISVLPLPKISDTGITTCIDDVQAGEGSASSGLDCSLEFDAEGDRIPKGQDGHVGLSAKKYRIDNSGFIYTKLNDKGDELPDNAENWSCVRDDITGLVWEIKTDDGGLHDKNFSYGWMPTQQMMDSGIEGTAHAGNCSLAQCNTESFVQAVNQAGLCGRSDWQMPDISELGSIIHYGKQESAINSQFFINENTSRATWSSTPIVPTEYFSGFTKVVWFTGGERLLSHHTDGNRVRLVNRNFGTDGEQ